MVHCSNTTASPWSTRRTSCSLWMHYYRFTFDHVGMPIVFLHRKPQKAKNALQISRLMPNWVTIALRFTIFLGHITTVLNISKLLRCFTISAYDVIDIPNHQVVIYICLRICQDFAHRSKSAPYFGRDLYFTGKIMVSFWYLWSRPGL